MSILVDVNLQRKMPSVEAYGVPSTTRRRMCEFGKRKLIKEREDSGLRCIVPTRSFHKPCDSLWKVNV